MALDRAESDAGDIAELYASLSERLERIVGMDVRAPEPIIEDACQSAWDRLWLHRRQVRRDTALSWLVTTAVHEALRMLRVQAGLLSLEREIEELGDGAVPAHAPPAADLYELRTRLDGIRSLSQRQQLLLWLQGLGFSYAEIAARTGSKTRTVERQLLRAKRKVRTLAGE
ncbi:MAG: sigma factor-like helix-turn-helix DNA-binding protein [Solirubrobacteraceae bacterium]